jgi:hypothetical protein
VTDFTDLIGLRYRFGGTDPRDGVDCLWTARRALERIFPDFRAEELPVTQSEQAARLALARQGIESWTRVGENVFGATRVGDLLVGERGNGGLFVAVLVDVEKRDAITATPENGVLVMPLRRLLGVRDVLRRTA